MDKGRVEESWIPVGSHMAKVTGPKADGKKKGGKEMWVERICWGKFYFFIVDTSLSKRRRVRQGARMGSRLFLCLMPGLCPFLAAPLDQETYPYSQVLKHQKLT